MISSAFIKAQSDPVALASAFLRDQDLCLEVLESSNLAFHLRAARQPLKKALWREAYQSARWWVNGRADFDAAAHLAAMRAIGAPEVDDSEIPF